MTRGTLCFYMMAILAGSTFDFFFFRCLGQVGFVLHNLMAFAIGAGLVGCSLLLLSETSTGKLMLMTNILVGASMMILHLALLVWGRCA